MGKKWCIHNWSEWAFDGEGWWRICLKCGHGEYDKTKWRKK